MSVRYFNSMEEGTRITQIMIADQSHGFLTKAPFETCTYENNGTSFYCNIDLSSSPSSSRHIAILRKDNPTSPAKLSSSAFPSYHVNGANCKENLLANLAMILI